MKAQTLNPRPFSPHLWTNNKGVVVCFHAAQFCAGMCANKHKVINPADKKVEFREEGGGAKGGGGQYHCAPGWNTGFSLGLNGREVGGIIINNTLINVIVS